MTDVDIVLHLAYLSQQLVELVEHRVNRCNCLTPGQVSTLLFLEDTLPEDLQARHCGSQNWPCWFQSRSECDRNIFLSSFTIFVFSSSSHRPGNLCWWRSVASIDLSELVEEVASCSRQRNCMNLSCNDSALMSASFNFMLGPNLRKITTKVRLVVNYASTEAVSWQQTDRLFLQDQKKVLLVWTFHEILLPLLLLQYI